MRMEHLEATNYIRLVGTATGSPEFSHSSRGKDFYVFPLTAARLSGNTDTLNILLRREQLADLPIQAQDRLCVEGEVRSFNSRKGTGARLVITVLAREIDPCEEEDSNLVVLRGTLCRLPTLRTTPMGREICDLMLAVNRPYGRSDYLPCICWGLSAREASGWGVGTVVRLDGRLQSRDYIKLTDDGPLHRTAFEISATTIRLIPETACSPAEDTRSPAYDSAAYAPFPPEDSRAQS